MAVDTKVISVPFAQGVDTKTDAKLSVKPSRLEGMAFQGGTLVKRAGTAALTSVGSPDGSAIAGTTSAGTLRWWPLYSVAESALVTTEALAEALFPFGTEVVRIDRGVARSLGPGGGEWVQKPGSGNFCTLTSARIQRNTRTQYQFDQATLNGVTVFAWIETTTPQQGLHIAVMDEATGAFYVNGDVAIPNTANAYFPRCLVVGGQLMVIWVDMTARTILCKTLSPAIPTGIGNTVTVATDVTGGITYTFTGFDARAMGNMALVTYLTGATTIGAVCIGPTGAVLTSPAKVASLLTSATNPAVIIDSNGIAYIFYVSNSQLMAYIVPLSGALTAGTSYVLSPQTAPVQTPCLGETLPGVISVVYPYNSVGAAGNLSTCTVRATGPIAPVADILGTVYLSPLTDIGVINGVPAIAVGWTPTGTNVQPTTWVIDLTGNAIAKALPGLADNDISLAWSGGSKVGRGHLAVSGNAVSFLVGQRNRIRFTSASGVITDVTTRGFSRVTLNPAGPGGVPVNVIGGAAYMGGALPRMYDGRQVVDTGFGVPPTAPSITISAGGGLSAAGVYQWRSVCSWTDGQGQLHRSIPSPAATATPVGAAQKATVAVGQMPLAMKDLLPAGISVQMELYRTTVNGSIFYRVDSPSSPVYNRLDTTPVNVVDTVSDASAQSGELLYTTGGVYDWVAPPAYKASCVHKTRLVIVGLEDAYEWRSSSQARVSEGLRFNEAWGGRVPPTTGPLVGCASMDGNLFLFTTGAVYVVTGDGPDLLGNNAWPPAQLVTSCDAGATSWQSIAATPMGILFKSSRGWKFIGRDLSCQSVGADVEAYNAYTPKAVTLRPESEEIWIQCDTGSDLQGGLLWWPLYNVSTGGLALVFNYRYQQWSVLPNCGAQSACYYGGAYTRLRSDAAALPEAAGAYTDAGTHYPQVLETSWVKMAGVQGFQRLRWVELLGSYGSPCTLTWEVAYDYSPTYNPLDTDTYTIGQQAAGTPVQLRRRMRIQKCEAVKFRFTITTASGTTGQGLSLTDLTFEVGAKRGAYKLPASQTL